MSRDWELVQEKAFTAWVNSCLEEDEKITDIVKDFSNGVRHIHFLERLSGKKVGTKYENDPKSRIHSIQNHHIALKFVETLDVRALGVGSEDFVDGNKKLILGFLWTLYRKFRIAVISEGDKSSEEGLLLWCKNTTSGYKGVNIASFKTGFRDGSAFLALAHKYNPELFNYETYENETPEARLVQAFEIAEKTINIPKLLDVHEVIKGTTDERSLILYSSLFFHAFRAKAQQELHAQSESEAASRLSNLENSLQNEKTSREALLRQKEELEKYKGQLDSELEAKDKTVGDLQALNASLQAEIEELKSKLNGLKDQVSHLEEKRHTLKGKLRDKTVALDEEKKTNEEVTLKLVNIEKEKAELIKEKTDLRAKLENTTKDKQTAQTKIEEDSKRAEVEFSGLLVLRQQLDQHVTDMHQWRKLLEVEDITNFPAQVKPAIIDDLAKTAGFDDQLTYLKKKLADETTEIQKYLAEKEEIQKQKMKKPEKK